MKVRERTLKRTFSYKVKRFFLRIKKKMLDNMKEEVYNDIV